MNDNARSGLVAIGLDGTMPLEQEGKPRMLRDGEVFFEIRHADLKRAIRQVQSNAKNPKMLT